MRPKYRGSLILLYSTALFVLAVLVTTPALADPDAAIPYPTPIVNDNGTVTLNNVTLPLIESRAIVLNDSELVARNNPMTHEEFMEANRQYIDFLAGQFGRAQVEKMANAEYDPATSGSSLPSAPVNGTGTTAGTGTVPATKPAPVPGIVSLAATGATAGIVAIKKLRR
ncbi:hypothetical protein [Methanoregula sp.]|jgi:hypothetical protein|uniref:hypothetical protein n=1 Tax=Methanoregula sp. TaxID=2052170 RepID=UPI00356203F7